MKFWRLLFSGTPTEAKPAVRKPEAILLAVSKPGSYQLTSGPSNYKTKTDVLIELYIQGTNRFWLVDGKTPEVKFARLEFWAKTGEFHDPADRDHFQWILSLREQKQQLLKELIAMDVDDPK